MSFPIRLRLAIVACCVCAWGCVDGPLNGGGTLNPFLAKEWAKDERRGPTFHTQIAALNAIRDGARNYPPERQETLAQELAQRFRNEPNVLLRAGVVDAAGSLSGSSVPELLAAAAVDEELEVRWAAVRAAGRRGDEASIKLLGQIIAGDRELDIRMSAARELGRFRESPEAVKALALGLDDDDAAMQHLTIGSLQRVTGKDYGMSTATWKEYLAGGNPTPPPGPSIAQQVRGWIWW